MTAELWEEVLSLAAEHLFLTLLAISIAIVIALPSAVWLSRRPLASRIALNAANITQAVPSLALFGLLLPLPLIGGIGKRTAVTVLVLYALLPLLRNAIVGIAGVDKSVRESAIAMGMTGRQVLFQVELPLAIPSITAGIRIATVTTIGTATIASAIGGGGLGV
ncbi:MAG: ABC transporter permease, partial [Bryobacteraceae bacterium]|nr:ABC transporter permease [Bryobacteraceae bacterium]